MLTKPKAWLCRDKMLEQAYVIVMGEESPGPDCVCYVGAEFEAKHWESISDLRLEPGGEPIAIELTVEKARETSK